MLAKKFPELKGLEWVDFLRQLPIKLDFITANEIWEELNSTKN